MCIGARVCDCVVCAVQSYDASMQEIEDIKESLEEHMKTVSC